MDTVYSGIYCSGEGNKDWLKLLDDSLSMLHPTPLLPNLSMIYNPGWDSFKEGFIWGNGWWMQNSYGFGFNAAPLLSAPWFDVLQHGMDEFWKRIGDGKRRGADEGFDTDRKIFQLVAPDGSLGDCVFENSIIYKQGDGHFDLYDWFYEATAAGVLMQAEWLLRGHCPDTARRYIPLILRSCNFIEGARAENGLFLVGPGCNLLAPSFGAAYDSEKKELQKSYLTGLSVTYAGALKRMSEVFRLVGDTVNEALFRERLQATVAALPLLLTEEGYFVKSMEVNGTKHGVYGQEKYGYLEGVCNADAVAFDVVPRSVQESIYAKLASVKGIRPFELLLTNHPHLDDTYKNYLDGDSLPDKLIKSGDWVDGGSWATVEGRAVRAYMRLDRYDDAYRACARYMRWAEDYRQDAPLSQYGENKYNLWQKEYADERGIKELRPVSVMVDNFATSAALPRNLFEYNYTADAIELTVHLPEGIKTYVQHAPVHFGRKELYISAVNGKNTPVCYINGARREVGVDGVIRLSYDELADANQVEIVMGEGEIQEALRKPLKREMLPDLSLLPQELRDMYPECERLCASADAHISALAREAKAAFEAAALRRALPFDGENFRPMTEFKKEAILNLYDEAARNLFAGIKR